MIEPLRYRNAISITREMLTHGHSPLEIIANDYNTYFVKSASKTPCYYLLSEFLCSYLLKCWRIPTPEIAAISIDPSVVQLPSPSRHKAHNFDSLCFGSLSIPDVIESTEITLFGGKPSFKKLSNPETLFTIALFDIWTENDDRKQSNHNLLLQPIDGKFRIVAIDHAYTFSSIPYEDLNPEYVSSSCNETILLSSIGLSVLKQTERNASWLSVQEDNFYLCIQACEQNFELIAAQLPTTLGFDERLKDKLREFLFNSDRNKLVFDEFTSRVEVK